MSQYVRQFPLPAIDDRIVDAVRACINGDPAAPAAVDRMVAFAFS
jgi:hypothetical protein